MNNIKFLLTLALCFCCSLSYAQKRISGRVWSKQDGGIVMAVVVEQDKNNRNVTAAQTDANGNFSMVIKNPANHLRVSYIGYQTKIVQIGQNSKFNIELIDKNTFSEATVSVTRKQKNNGLVIPEREISTAQQSLDMDRMAGLSFETAADALQGEIAGLDIVANSGNLGSGSSMRLRGVSSINGSQEPLIVVDGNILEDYSSDQLDLNDMENQEQFATLLQVSPEDIQTIKVLKDAAATAIWGARGSNGVIEITTRRGARGKTHVNFSYRFTGSWQPDGMEMLDGDGYTMMLKEAYSNPQAISDEQASIVEIMYKEDTHPSYYANFNKNTDWVKEVTQFGQRHNYGVSISGGGEKATFRVSGTYDHETGTIIKQALDRLTTRLALDYWVSDRIKFSSNFALTYTKNQKNYDDGLLGYAYKAMPNMSVYRYERRNYDDGTHDYYNTGEYFIMPPTAAAAGLVGPSSGYSSYYLSDMVNNGNPVAIANQAWRNQSTYTIQPQFQLTYKLLGKNDDETKLDYRGEVFLNAYTESLDSYYPGSLTSKSWDSGINTTSNYENKNLSFTTRHEFTFQPHFANDNHALQALVRWEMSTNNNTQQYLSSSGISGGISDPTVPGYLTGSTTSTGKGHSMAALASFHYSFGSRYNIDVTLRADGSTKFGSGNKWGFFPGLSGRWNISDEKFFKPLRKYINMLGFAPGWGITGNTPGSEGLMYNKYDRSGESYNGTQVIVPTNLRLDQIRWEKTKSWNIGVYLNIFEDLIQMNLNVYNRKTSDLLNSGVRIPSTTGFSRLTWANVGDMKNQGWELYANTRPILKFGKFHVVLRGNIAQNINTITKMDASVLSSNNADYDYSSGNLSYMKRVQIGNALGGIYGFKYKGVYAYDYDHSGYFTNPEKNKWTNPDGTSNTAAYGTNERLRKSTPVVFDANGNVVYDKSGNPLHMVYNYGGVNYEFDGGDAIYEDINHDGQIDELDIVYLGTSNPKVNGGFGVDFVYGQWQLKTSFNFRIGNKIINMARMRAEAMRGNNNQSAAVNHRWRKNGQETTIPRAMNSSVVNTYNSLMSDRFVEPGDFLRFQYFQLSYNVKPEKLKKVGLSSLRISASGNNLIFWTKYSGVDPEHSQSGLNPCVDDSQTPRSRSFTFSLNFGF